MQVICIADSIDENFYILDNCDCRFNQMNCNKRIDTCFKQNKKGKNFLKKIKNLDSERLVRIHVNNGGFRTEICHCCTCCCVPLIIQSFVPEKLINSSGHLPVIRFDSCTQCGICQSICPFYAIDKDLKVNEIKCLGCGLCWNNCKGNAIEMREKSCDSRIKIPNRLFSFTFSIIFYSYFFTLQKVYSKSIS